MSIDLVNNRRHWQALWAQTGVLLLFTILGQALSSALTKQQTAKSAMATAQSQIKQLV